MIEVKPYNFVGKRYATWTDETLWSPTAVLSGLRYGVYDHKLNRKCFDTEQGGIITSYEQAKAKAIEMNKKLKE